MVQPDYTKPSPDELLTHYLQGRESDPIVQKIKSCKLNTGENDLVKVIFVPTYLDGNDGVFNISYQDLLLGFDIGVFPSFYEPWGYTPMECLAFQVPAITTDVSGFGAAAIQASIPMGRGLTVLPRNDQNEKQVVRMIAEYLEAFSKKPDNEVQEIRSNAYEISLSFSWQKLICNYEKNRKLPR